MPDDLSNHRFFRVDSAHYSTYTDYVNESRGYPHDHTARGLPLFAWLLREPTTGWALCPIGKWRIDVDDDVVIAQAIASGEAVEISADQYVAERDAILNPPEPPDPPDPPEPPLPPEPPEPPLPPEPPFPPDPTP